MARDRDITVDNPPGAELGHRHDTGGDGTAGLTVIALLLALLLGFSAADQQTLDAGPGMSQEQGQTVLDGRGKWGGYLM